MDRNLRFGPPPKSERRKAERRRDTAKYKLLSRLLALRRAFGVETLAKVALKIGFNAEDTARLAEIGRERRLLRRREYLPAFKPSHRASKERGAKIPSNSLSDTDIDALRWLARKKSGGPRLKPGDYPPKLLNLGFIFRNCDGDPVLTHKGQQLLLHHSCVEGALRVRETGQCVHLDATVREWLENNRFITVAPSGDCLLTSKGSTWIESTLSNVATVDPTKTDRVR